MYSMLWRHVECDVPTFRDMLRVQISWSALVHHNIACHVPRRAHCHPNVMRLLNVSFQRRFRVNFRNQKCVEAYRTRVRCNTLRSSLISETAYSYIHNIRRVCTDRQTDTSGRFSALASCQLTDSHILLYSRNCKPHHLITKTHCNIFPTFTVVCNLHSHQLFKKRFCSRFTKHKSSYRCVAQIDGFPRQ
jgi:hypothetical protein